MSVHATSHYAYAQRARAAAVGTWGAMQAELMAEDSGRASLLAETRKAIRALGLHAYHTRRSDGSDKGFPDLVITGPGGILFRELKTETGKVTPEQLDWLHWLTQAGQNADVWRPTDWYGGRITRELTAIRKGPQ